MILWIFCGFLIGYLTRIPPVVLSGGTIALWQAVVTTAAVAVALFATSSVKLGVARGLAELLAAGGVKWETPGGYLYNSRDWIGALATVYLYRPVEKVKSVAGAWKLGDGRPILESRGGSGAVRRAY